MAGSTRKSLAGTAAAAAKRVVGQGPATDAPAEEGPASSAPPKSAAEKSAAEKSAAKKAPAKKAAAKTPAKSSAKTTAPTEKAAPVTKAVPTPATKATPTKKVRKATPSTLVVLDGESAWTRGELNEVVKELTEHQERLTAIVGRSAEELAGLMRDAGDGAGLDQADVGATSFERDHELTVLAKEREALAQIERALSHIDDGTYGVCDSCGNAIGKNRLMAVPHATLCMSCKQREERR
ncbi:TraR/DksA family transcriptional regulator [Nocardioides xinjiangensis]|uniref:TraR/DksA family transcriptional regulator n=1 Tax=Nocardioides xinjiangensis TaxID=2817376 RepID=UPI001B308838|nr:TraR/DksA family transcriptional regulator [Nocardioides sp. SYSU D00778]